MQGTDKGAAAPTIYSPPSSSFKASALRSISEPPLFFRSREERNMSRISLNDCVYRRLAPVVMAVWLLTELNIGLTFVLLYILTRSFPSAVSLYSTVQSPATVEGLGVLPGF